MTSPQALLSLLAHAERERNRAMSEAKRSEMEHRNAQRQAEQLLAYRGEQRAALGPALQRRGGRRHRDRAVLPGFHARLGDAVAAQQRRRDGRAAWSVRRRSGSSRRSASRRSAS